MCITRSAPSPPAVLPQILTDNTLLSELDRG
jgi:hypothetical protein